MSDDANVDEVRWESAHRAAYGCGAWERARHQADVLVAWHTERSAGFGEPVRRAPRVKWPWGSGSSESAMGLVLWRLALETGVLVDQVLLTDAVRFCEPGATSLPAGPLPDEAWAGGIGVAGAESVAGVGRVLQAHVADGSAQSPRGTAAQATVGRRVRELRATPDWDGGDWPAALTLARRAMRQADDQRGQGTWRPTARERTVAARTRLDREPALEATRLRHPAPPWPARARRLLRLAVVLSTAADALPSEDGSDPSPPARALSATADACALLRTSIEEIEHLWAAEPRVPADPADWELSHVPEALRTQIEETEHLVRAAETFLWMLACS
ncbi:hypothetical protein ACIRQH_02120 [Streptomyces sp. NPDC102279]|uniref:hypothetical protein n=1 Tax=Streptomyces sp. NPDC102279 TaxID=3366153 RepID=UPI0037F740F4